MSNIKAVFFDIDGTLWDFRNHIPESTREAIKLLRSNGHLAFINSGRSRGYIRNPKLLDLGFDGIVSGCGTAIEYNDKVEFLYELSKDSLEHAVKTVRELGFKPILEGFEYLYMDDHEFKGDLYGEKLFRDLGDRRHTIDNEWGMWNASKFSCATIPQNMEKCFEKLGEEYDFIVHTPEVAEFVPKGFSKGTGIIKTCEILALDVKDTIAIGDSVNDLDMFRVAGTSVAMGNGSDIAKENATFVTTPMNDDGIYNALTKLGLI